MVIDWFKTSFCFIWIELGIMIIYLPYLYTFTSQQIKNSFRVFIM